MRKKRKNKKQEKNKRRKKKGKKGKEAQIVPSETVPIIVFLQRTVKRNRKEIEAQKYQILSTQQKEKERNKEEKKRKKEK